MAVPPLRDVAPEILSEILGFLDAKTLLLCSSVCNLWHNAVKGSPELQYTIELWADGMLVAGLFVQQEQGPDFLAISLARIVDEPQTARYTYSIDRNLQSFEDFVIDPTQDLIVRFYTPPGELAYLECRTLSSQEPHPLAKTDVLAFSLDRDPIGIFSIQIADDIIGIFFLEAPFNFKLFNWRVGITIAELEDQVIEIPLPIAEFHLLSPRSYIFAHASFDLGDTRQIDIYAFDGECANYPTHVATLELPKLLPNVYVTNLMIQAAPYTPEKWYRLFVHYRWFYKYVLNHCRGKSKFTTVVPWDEWGPQNSVLLPGGNHQWKGFRQVHGERVALPCPGLDFRAIKILDFGIVPKRLVSTSGNDSPSTAEFAPQLYMESIILKRDSLFEDTVTTFLPYMSMVRLLDEDHDLFLLDQNRIIAMDVSVGSLAHKALTASGSQVKLER
ncbi:hypothetical protein B0H14DRAFT_2616103 [Mycena olivaceomarginata]|nr:hypothetical protein B0H14DRAFT_2616103 [Mycena olivaceomarginata]